jgi:DNA repair protein RecO (recombination protein O)
MQTKTTGIILHTTRFNDSASIATVYTRQLGRVSYLVYGVNKKKSVCRNALLQPLSIVELDVTHIHRKDMQQIREIRMGHQFTGIPFHLVKNSVALFLSEVLFKTLRNSVPDDNLYLFIENSILQLDYIEKGIQNFHLVFLLKLTRFLGFEPNVEKGGNYFDLLNGVFHKEKPLHIHILSPEVTLQFSALLETDYQTLEKLILTREQRSDLLKSLIEYYRLHLPEFHNIHSLSVLQSLFD